MLLKRTFKLAKHPDHLKSTLLVCHYYLRYLMERQCRIISINYIKASQPNENNI